MPKPKPSQTSTTSLKDQIFQKTTQIYKLKLDLSAGKLKNTRSIFLERKNLARLKTKAREVELEP